MSDDPITSIDHLNANLAARAAILHAYFDTLTNLGFQRSEALSIVLDLQTELADD